MSSSAVIQKINAAKEHIFRDMQYAQSQVCENQNGGWTGRLSVLNKRLGGCAKLIDGLRATPKEEEEPVCSICLDKLGNPSFCKWNGATESITQEDANKLFITQCGHAFHTNCFEKWRRDHNWNCPCCRRGEI